PSPGALRMPVPPLQLHGCAAHECEGELGLHRPQPPLTCAWLDVRFSAESCLPDACTGEIGLHEVLALGREFVGRVLKRGRSGTGRWLGHASAASWICLLRDAPSARHLAHYVPCSMLRNTSRRSAQTYSDLGTRSTRSMPAGMSSIVRSAGRRRCTRAS